MRRASLWIIAFTVPALAACAASSGPIAAASGASSTTRSDTALELSQCMRSHGVPNFPDPSASGGFQVNADTQSPAFQQAQEACKKYAPLKDGPPKMTEGQRRAATRFARCMRANGQSDFPDPTLVPAPGTTHVLVLQGMVFAFSSEAVNPASPGFKEAAKKCGVSSP